MTHSTVQRPTGQVEAHGPRAAPRVCSFALRNWSFSGVVLDKGRPSEDEIALCQTQTRPPTKPDSVQARPEGRSLRLERWLRCKCKPRADNVRESFHALTDMPRSAHLCKAAELVPLQPATSTCARMGTSDDRQPSMEQAKALECSSRFRRRLAPCSVHARNLRASGSSLAVVRRGRWRVARRTCRAPCSEHPASKPQFSPLRRVTDAWPLSH